MKNKLSNKYFNQEFILDKYSLNFFREIKDEKLIEILFNKIKKNILQPLLQKKFLKKKVFF